MLHLVQCCTARRGGSLGRINPQSCTRVPDALIASFSSTHIATLMDCMGALAPRNSTLLTAEHTWSPTREVAPGSTVHVCGVQGAGHVE